MRKLYGTALFVIITTAANAQFSKGKILLGGSINAGTSKQTTANNNVESNGFNISPTIGTFYKENHLVGVKLNYGHYKSGSPTISRSNSYGGGLFLRQYRSIGSGFFFFAEEGFSASYTKSANNIGFNENVNRNFGVSVALRPGVSYAVKKNLQLELIFNDLVYLGYSSEKNIHVPTGTTNKSSGFNIGSNLTLTPLNNIGIGVKFLLGK